MNAHRHIGVVQLLQTTTHVIARDFHVQPIANGNRLDH